MIKVREANRSEALIIKDFQLKMALETEGLKLNEILVEKGVKAVFDDNNKGVYYVAEYNGDVVASLLTTYEWSDWRNSMILWIQSVYVLADCRKLGIFKQMYAYVKEMVQNNERFAGIRLYVDKTNTNAQKVYNAIGMNGEHYSTFEWMK